MVGCSLHPVVVERVSDFLLAANHIFRALLGSLTETTSSRYWTKKERSRSNSLSQDTGRLIIPTGLPRISRPHRNVHQAGAYRAGKAICEVIRKAVSLEKAPGWGDIKKIIDIAPGIR